METKSCYTCLLKSRAAENLGDWELNMLGKNCVQVAFEKGETIFKQNALSSNIIYLQTGLVKLIIEGPQRKQILEIKKAPCYLGLPTTMGAKINHYSAVALETTTACFIDINTFKQLLRMNTDFSYEIIIELCKNELDHFHRCVNLVQSQIFGRLAANLLQFADEIYQSDEFDMPLSRSELADLICTSRETVSRSLNELAEEKIIELQGKHLRILNKDMLRKIREKG